MPVSVGWGVSLARCVSQWLRHCGSAGWSHDPFFPAPTTTFPLSRSSADQARQRDSWLYLLLSVSLLISLSGHDIHIHFREQHKHSDMSTMYTAKASNSKMQPLPGNSP